MFSMQKKYGKCNWKMRGAMQGWRVGSISELTSDRFRGNKIKTSPPPVPAPAKKARIREKTWL